MIRVSPGPLAGLVVVELDVHGDERGFFLERFNARDFEAAGLPAAFVQDNHSRSSPGVVRGLHYQYDPPQGKLVGVARGRIWDVAVDLRKGSSTFGKWFGLAMADLDGTLLWIPPGFAHGFCVVGDEPADLLYKVTTPYASGGEFGIAHDDPELDIAWPIPLDERKVSRRDRELPRFSDYRLSPRW